MQNKAETVLNGSQFFSLVLIFFKKLTLSARLRSASYGQLIGEQSSGPSLPEMSPAITHRDAKVISPAICISFSVPQLTTHRSLTSKITMLLRQKMIPECFS